MRQLLSKNYCLTLKIKDGIFLGEGRSPQLSQFINNNKISCIINCAAPDVVTPMNNTRVLSFNWKDSDEQTILAPSTLPKFQLIYSAIEETLGRHEAVLICSLRGQSRSLTILTAYLMRRYKWSLYKTLEYLNNRRQDFQLRTNFLKQLVWYQGNLYGKKLKNCTKSWEEVELMEDGVLLRNTYLNAVGRKQEFSPKMRKRNKKVVAFDRVVSFIDTGKTEMMRVEEDESIDSHIKGDNYAEITKSIEKEILKCSDSMKKPRRNVVKAKQRSSSMYHHRQPTPYKLTRQEPPIQPSNPKSQIQFNINLNINSLNIISSSSQNKSSLMKRLKQGERIGLRRSHTNFKNNQKIMMYLPEEKVKKKPDSPYRRKMSVMKVQGEMERIPSDRSRSFSINKKISRRVKTEEV